MILYADVKEMTGQFENLILVSGHGPLDIEGNK